MWRYSMRRSMDINHPYFSHAMRGRGRSLGAQSRQLTVSGLLSVQRGVVYGVCGAGAAVRPCGADRGTVEPSHTMLGTVQTRTGVWSMCVCQHIRLCVNALRAAGETVTFIGHVLVRLHVPPLQDGAGTGRDGADRGVGQSFSGHGGTAGEGALPWPKRDPGRGGGHGVRVWG